MAALKRHLVEKVAASDLCDELDISPTLFYSWLKAFFENGHTAFDNGRKTKAVEDSEDKKIERLEAKLQRKNEVLAELMEEHTLLKKELGETLTGRWVPHDTREALPTKTPDTATCAMWVKGNTVQLT